MLRKKLSLLAVTFLFCHLLQAQYLMDMVDTSKETGRGLLALYKKFDHLKLSGYIQPQFQVAQSKGIKSFEGGDFATNVALQLATAANMNPRAVATQLAAEIESHPSITSATVAGPGFINLTLTATALVSMLQADLTAVNHGKRVLLEFSCPNAFKELHTGHLYQTIAGDAIG